MDKKQFVTFIRDGRALDQDLTTIDCQFIFRKAKATAAAPDSVFKDCLIHQKRLTYTAVRVLALSQAALFKGIPTGKFIQVLAAGLRSHDKEAVKGGGGGGEDSASNRKPIEE